MVALRGREQTGRGQVVDTLADRAADDAPRPAGHAPGTGSASLQPRTGNRSSHNAPRNVYRTADGAWVAVSASAPASPSASCASSAAPTSPSEPWFATGAGRAAHVEEIDGAVAAWIAERPRDEVLRAFEEQDAAIAPIYDASDIAADPQLAAIGAIAEVDDPELGVAAHVERDRPPHRDAGRDPLGRPRRRAPTRPRCSASSASTPPSSSGCAAKGSCDPSRR